MTFPLWAEPARTHQPLAGGVRGCLPPRCLPAGPRACSMSCLAPSDLEGETAQPYERGDCSSKATGASPGQQEDLARLNRRRVRGRRPSARPRSRGLPLDTSRRGSPAARHLEGLQAARVPGQALQHQRLQQSLGCKGLTYCGKCLQRGKRRRPGQKETVACDAPAERVSCPRARLAGPPAQSPAP